MLHRVWTPQIAVLLEQSTCSPLLNRLATWWVVLTASENSEWLDTHTLAEGSLPSAMLMGNAPASPMLNLRLCLVYRVTRCLNTDMVLVYRRLLWKRALLKMTQLKFSLPRC